MWTSPHFLICLCYLEGQPCLITKEKYCCDILITSSFRAQTLFRGVSEVGVRGQLPPPLPYTFWQNIRRCITTCPPTFREPLTPLLLKCLKLCVTFHKWLAEQQCSDIWMQLEGCVIRYQFIPYSTRTNHNVADKAWPMKYHNNK